MSQAVLLYSPVLVSDCESAWTDGTFTGCTNTLESTVKLVGSGSAKLVMTSGAGAGLLAQKNIGVEGASGVDLSAKTYVAFWVRCSQALSAGDMSLVLDENIPPNTPSETLVFPAIAANKWMRLTFPLVSATSDRNLIACVGLKMLSDVGACTIYVDDVVGFIGRAFNVNYCKGLDWPEDHVFWPGTTSQSIGGSLTEKIVGYRRNPVLDLGVVTDMADALFLHNFVAAAEKRIVFNYDEATVVMKNPKSMEVDWREGIDFAKHYTLDFLEKQIKPIADTPPSWV